MSYQVSFVWIIIIIIIFNCWYLSSLHVMWWWQLFRFFRLVFTSTFSNNLYHKYWFIMLYIFFWMDVEIYILMYVTFFPSKNLFGSEKCLLNWYKYFFQCHFLYDTRSNIYFLYITYAFYCINVFLGEIEGSRYLYP